MSRALTRVAVVGAGAMGSVYGSALHEAGLETTLVDVSAEIVDRIRHDGVTIVGADGERVVRLPATVDAAAVGPVDAVVFFVKCYHTAAATQTAAPLVGDDTAVITLQNGWGNGDVLAQAFGRERVVVGVSYHSATLLATARVAHTAVGPTLIGALDAAGAARAEAVAELLTRAGLPVTVPPDVRSEIWKKLVLNASALPTSALTGLVAGEVARPGPLLDLVDGLARETVAVGRAAGLEVSEEERLASIHAALERAGTGKASMLQDVEAGRRTEIDVINGAVAAMGAEHGVPTPLNDAMVALVKGYERGHGLT